MIIIVRSCVCLIHIKSDQKNDLWRGLKFARATYPSHTLPKKKLQNILVGINYQNNPSDLKEFFFGKARLRGAKNRNTSKEVVKIPPKDRKISL